mgnify:FL=1|tara:strand:+ start:10612 stop:10962 length:351 start_codon:yes stop_codon:yes gene_type:complete
MSFLDSEYVRASLVEINELQEGIFPDLMKFPYLSPERKLKHIKDLEKLLEKQKIMYTRVCLSKDPEALQIKENIEQTAQMLGAGKQKVDPAALFDQMYQTIANLRQMLEGQETLDK